MNRNILNLRHLTVLLMLCTAFLGAEKIQGVAAMEGIRTTGKLEGETEEKLKAALADYTDRFLKTR